MNIHLLVIFFVDYTRATPDVINGELVGFNAIRGLKEIFDFKKDFDKILVESAFNI